MSSIHEYSVARAPEAVLSTNKLIRNTYSLLSMTLLFSALMAGVSVALNPPPLISLGCSIVALLLMWFVLPKTANSTSGLGVVFAFTGLLGFGLGPTLVYHLAMPNGPQIVLTAAGATGVIFMALSGYALTTRKDFSFMGGFLMTGMIFIIIAMLANIFLQIPAMSLAISGVVVMLMSGFILYDTSRMVHSNGQENYLMMTVSLYLSILNIFVHLLSILGAVSGDD
jgi:modulator of FtsH protease